MKDPEKNASIIHLAKAADVNIPEKAPSRYAPMSWEQMRACEKKGMTFGPHTVTHPVLSQAPPEQASRELVDSWAKLCKEALRPVPIFCYPNGRWEDLGNREISMLKKLGIKGGVVDEPGYASLSSFQRNEDGPFKVQRFGFPQYLPLLVQYVSGFERTKEILLRWG